MAKKRLFRILFWLLLAVFCVSAAFLIRYGAESEKQKHLYRELAAMVEIPQTTAPQTFDVPETHPPEGTGILPEYAALYEMNTDMAGWIRIEGTQIDYPVMQTPEEPDYYLYRNFLGESSDHGCIYARETCDLITPSDNVTLYGHCMNDGSMFADLTNYLDHGFWEEHRYIRFDTLTAYQVYEIFAVFTTTASVGEGFAYHQFENAADEADFDWFIDQCRTLALYDTGITPQYGDKILCLSTCEYTQTNGRLVVAAVRVEEDMLP